MGLFKSYATLSTDFCKSTIRWHKIGGWGGRIRTLGMPEPESGALPLGDTPILFAETHK